MSKGFFGCNGAIDMHKGCGAYIAMPNDKPEDVRRVLQQTLKTFEPSESFSLVEPLIKRAIACNWALYPSEVLRDVHDKVYEGVLRSSFGQDAKIARCIKILIPYVVFTECHESVNTVNELRTNMETALTAHESRLSGHLESFNQASGSALQKIESRVAEAKKAVSTIYDIAAAGVVANQAEKFDEVAREHKRMGWIWLFAAVAFAIVLGIYVINVPDTLTETTPQFLSIIVPKALFIILLTTGMFICLRNFTSCRHNYVVNKHRETALRTFDVFVHATKEPQIKDAVLLAANQAIFSPQPTGYLKTEPDGPQMNHITEIVRGITRHSPPS